MWASLHGDADRLRNLVVDRNTDGRLEVFGIASDDTIWHTSQAAPSNDWRPVSCVAETYTCG